MESSWNDSRDFKFLVDHLCSLVKKSPPGDSHKRWLVGIVGIPSSGKSFAAKKLRDAVNQRFNNKTVCECIGMDGYHYTRSFLSNKFDYPRIAHAKRGAYWTFDAFGFGRLLNKIATFDNGYVLAPTFDHALKDPSWDEKNGTKIFNDCRVVIVEGLYLFLTKNQVWNTIVNPLFNERWYLECDFKLAEKRIVRRHVESGICKNNKDALFRWLDNDKPNGITLIDNLPNESQLNVIFKAMDPHGIKLVKTQWDKCQGSICPNLEQFILQHETEFVKVPPDVVKDYFAKNNPSKL